MLKLLIKYSMSIYIAVKLLYINVKVRLFNSYLYYSIIVLSYAFIYKFNKFGKMFFC